MRSVLFIIFLLSANVVHSQKSSFTLKGTVNVDTGTILLLPRYNAVYYPDSIDLSAPIVKGKFTFLWDISYPVPVVFVIKEHGKVKYFSTSFLLDKGTQKAAWETNAKHSTQVNIDNAATRERMEFLELLKPGDARLHELSVAINSLGTDEKSLAMKAQLLKQRDSVTRENEQIILRYSNEHPASVIPLWDMVFALDRGYSNFLDTFDNAMPGPLRSTVTGKQYGEGVEKLRRTAIGSTFPQLEVLDKDDAKIKLAYDHRYTFIDFWFTGCYPCKRLFPGFEQIYNRFHNKGFEFIAITTDEDELVDSWKKYLQNSSLPWPQYRDESKHNANMLLIERYPTSFLLDKEGKIIAKDMLPEELERLLEVNLE